MRPKHILRLSLLLLLSLAFSLAIDLKPGLSLAAAKSDTDPEKVLHVLNRLGYGPLPGDIEKVQQMGLKQYINQQLHPDSIIYPDALNAALVQLSTRSLTPLELFQQYGPPLRQMAQKSASPEEKERLLQEFKDKSNQLQTENLQARFLRASQSPRQLEEVMVDFWFNHFNVFSGKDGLYIWVNHYEDHAIRPYVLGHFRDLLSATAHHPAMLFYLDNTENTAPGSPGAKGRESGLNENYARELMELHTLGVDGGYTQKDVTELARVLTGWSIVLRDNQAQKLIKNGQDPDQILKEGFYFEPKRHDFGTKVVLGHTIQGTGASELDTILDILSQHPATAHHISYQLAQAFVADNPPEALVKKLQERYLKTHGDIRSVLETLFRSSEFWNPQYYQAKYKDPYRYLMSTIRITGTPVDNPMQLQGILRKWGMPLYGCQPPTGYKNTQEAWLSPFSMISRINIITGWSRGGFPLHTNQPLDASSLEKALDHQLSDKTQAAIQTAPPELKATVLLGSPDWMMY